MKKKNQSYRVVVDLIDMFSDIAFGINGVEKSKCEWWNELMYSKWHSKLPTRFDSDLDEIVFIKLSFYLVGLQGLEYELIW